MRLTKRNNFPKMTDKTSLTDDVKFPKLDKTKVKCDICGKKFLEEDMDLEDGMWTCRNCSTWEKY